MKSTETTAAHGRAVALEILRSADSDELIQILENGLPGGLFTALAGRSMGIATPRKKRGFVCGYASSSTVGLSGLRPQIFINSDLPEIDAVSSVASALFEMARCLYLGAVPGADSSDLDAWLAAELPAEIREVSLNFFDAYSDDRSMFRIDSAGAPAALCSFTALRRLVLQDA